MEVDERRGLGGGPGFLGDVPAGGGEVGEALVTADVA